MDSVAALTLVKNDRAWKTYVQNRVKDILKVSSWREWYYLPGPSNPAELVQQCMLTLFRYQHKVKD